jgi:large subunit ribosomal protein L32
MQCQLLHLSHSFVVVAFSVTTGSRPAPEARAKAGQEPEKPWLSLGKRRRGYTARPLMAVPKRKTSKSRRDKRRAQHRISAPRLSLCPNCHQPTRPHQMCPTCKTYRGREIEPLRPLGQ